MLTETTSGSTLSYASFFEAGEYFVNDRGTRHASSIEFDVQDREGKHLGKIVQKRTVGYKFLRLFFKKQALPLRLHLYDNTQQKLGAVERGWTLSDIRIRINNAAGEEIGAIRPKLSRSVTQYKIFKEGNKIAEINGGGEESRFAIIDNDHVIIGDITKEVPAEASPSGKRRHTPFRVAVGPGLKNTENRILVTAAALTLDIVVKGSR